MKDKLLFVVIFPNKGCRIRYNQLMHYFCCCCTAFIICFNILFLIMKCSSEESDLLNNCSYLVSCSLLRTASSISFMQFSPDGEFFATAGQVRLLLRPALNLYRYFKDKSMLDIRKANLTTYHLYFCCFCVCFSGRLPGEGLVQYQQVEVMHCQTVHTSRCQCEFTGRTGLFLCLPGPSSLCHWFLLEENKQIHASV